MGCDCGKPKCDGHCGVSPAVLQINNPSECVLFHRVEVPASMGDSKTNPPKNGDYKNVLLYYEADQTSWLYSSDGIPTKLTMSVKQPAAFTMQYVTGSPNSFLPGWHEGGIVEKIGVTNGTPAWGIYKTSLSSSGSDPNYPVTFLNEKTGDVISPEALYNLLLSGEDVVLNHVPLGVKTVDEWADDTAYADGVRLTKFVDSSSYGSVGFGGSVFIETFIPIYGENDGIVIQCQLGFSISGYAEGGALVYDQMTVRGINAQTE